MAKINFYRQARGDGGVRSGIDVDGDAAFSVFEAGTGEADPSLQWYVDIEWSGTSLPAQAEEARVFLQEQEPVVRTACDQLAERLALGIDEEPAPFTHPFDPGKAGIDAAIFCSAVRRMSGREMKQNLISIGSSWSCLLGALQPLSIEAS